MIRDSTIQYKTIESHSRIVQYNKMQWNIIIDDTIEYKTMEYNT